MTISAFMVDRTCVRGMELLSMSAERAPGLEASSSFSEHQWEFTQFKEIVSWSWGV